MSGTAFVAGVCPVRTVDFQARISPAGGAGETKNLSQPAKSDHLLY